MAIYYVASSASGQDEPNPALWLVVRAGKIKPSCPLGTTRSIPQEKFPESRIINSLLTKFVRSRWLDIGLVLFCEFVDLDFVSVHKHKSLANIQPSWPHAWSTTNCNTYYFFYPWEREEKGLAIERLSLTKILILLGHIFSFVLW